MGFNAAERLQMIRRVSCRLHSCLFPGKDGKNRAETKKYCACLSVILLVRMSEPVLVGREHIE
jgi:hypothetical protein